MHLAGGIDVRRQPALHAARPVFGGLFELETLRLARQCASHPGPEALAGSRAEQFLVRAPEDGFARHAETLDVRVVDEAVALRPVDVGDAQRQAVGDLAQEALALDHTRLEFLARGDVLEGAGQAHGLAAFEFDFTDGAHPDRLAARRDHLQFEVPRRACSHAERDRLLDARAGLRGVEIECAGQLRHVVGADLVDALGLVGPHRLLGRHVELPAADAGDSADAGEQRLAGAQLDLGALPVGDFAADRQQRRVAARVAIDPVRPGDPPHAALRVAHAVLAIGALAARHHLGDALAHAFAIGRVDEVEQASADQDLGRGTQMRGVRAVDEFELAGGAGHGDHLGLVFDDGAVLRFALQQGFLNLAARHQRFRQQAAAHFERFGDEAGQLEQHRPLGLVEVSRLAIDDAQRADAGTALQHQRCAGVEADVRVAGDQRIRGEAAVAACVGHLEDLVAGDGVVAESHVARRFVDARQAHVRLEPLAFLVDQADQRDRGAAERRCHSREPVEDRLMGTVEHQQLAQARQACGFAHGGSSREHVLDAGLGIRRKGRRAR